MRITQKSIYEQLTDAIAKKYFFNNIYLNEDDDPDNYVCEIIEGDNHYSFVLSTPEIIWAYTSYIDMSKGDKLCPASVKRVAKELAKAIADDKKGLLKQDEDGGCLGDEMDS